MKSIITITAVTAAIALCAQVAYGQSATSETSSQANNTANQVSASGAIAAGGNVVFNEAAQPSVQTINNTGRRELLAPGAANAPAVFSGTHSCALGVSGGLAGITGSLTGLSAGASYTDAECEVRQEAMVLAGMGMQQAAMIHLATHDNEVRCTLVSMRLISVASVGGDDGCDGKAARVAGGGSVTRTAAPAVQVGGALATIAYGKCEMRSDGKIELTVKRGADKATAISQCKSALR